MFDQTLTALKETTQRVYREAIGFAMQDLFGIKACEDAVVDTVVHIGELKFDIGNQVYAEYESQEAFIGE
jgi:hypothetical protein